MELYEAMRTTPATREFTDEPVPDEMLHRILDNARFAPSGGNRQGWRVIVVRDPELRRKVRDAYGLGWREYMAHVRLGQVPFAPLDQGRWSGPAVDLEEARRTPAPNPFGDNLDTTPPVLLMVWVELAALATVDNGLDRQSFVGGGSVYPFCHNVMLAARNEGLGGVITTVLAREEAAVRELVGAPVGFGLAGLIALGHPVKQVTRLRRRAVEEFTTVDRFDGRPFSV